MKNDKIAVNIEDVRPMDRNNLKRFGFTIGNGVHVSILAMDQADAVRRFRAQTDGDVVFITDAEMEKRRNKKADAELNHVLDVIDDANENVPASAMLRVEAA